MNWKKKPFSFSVFVFFLLMSCNSTENGVKESRVDVLPYYNEPSFQPNWLDLGSAAVDEFHKIPDFTLINQLGDTITANNFKDKIYVADFFFTTCPGICPKMTKNMAILQNEYLNDDEVFLLSHSVMPKTDTVEQLKSYADEHGVEVSTWFLATGDRAHIYDLGRNHYFVEENLGEEKDEDDFLHTEHFVLIDKNKHIRGIYNGLNKTAIQELIADIRTLKKEG